VGGGPKNTNYSGCRKSVIDCGTGEEGWTTTSSERYFREKARTSKDLQRAQFVEEE